MYEMDEKTRKTIKRADTVIVICTFIACVLTLGAFILLLYTIVIGVWN